MRLTIGCEIGFSGRSSAYLDPANRCGLARAVTTECQRWLASSELMKPSMRHREGVERLRAFHQAYVEMMNCTTVVHDWPSNRLEPKVDNSTWQGRQRVVARAAGAAASAQARYGGLMTLENVGRNLNPVMNWEWTLKDPRRFQPSSLVLAVEQAIGVAERQWEESRQRERGLTGLIAAFLRWPQNLREAVGPGRAQRRVAGALGILGQLLVATVAGALSVGLAAAVVKLWP